MKLALCHRHGGRLELAHRHLRRAVMFDPTSANAACNLAALYAEASKNERMISW